MHTLISKALTNIKKSDLHAPQKLRSYVYVIFSMTVNHKTLSILFSLNISIYFKNRNIYIKNVHPSLTEHLKWWERFLRIPKI